MSRATQNAHGGDRTNSGRGSHRPQSQDDQRNHKQQVLTHGTASAVHGIADALVIKDGDAFFLCKPDGDVPAAGGHGFGLYYNDCRFLRSYELRLAGDLADRLASSAADGDAMSIELTNPELKTSAHGDVPKERVGVSWQRKLDGEGLKLTDTITLQNFGVDPAEIPISLAFDAQFEDVFVVRGLIDDHPGTLHDPAWQGGKLVFGYDGADERLRQTIVRLNPAPARTNGTEATWQIHLDPHETQRLRVEIGIEVKGEGSSGSRDRDNSDADIKKRGQRAGARRTGDRRIEQHFTEIHSDSRLLEGIIDRSLNDLRVLRSYNAGAEYFAAGVPWFVALFGRDSVITALETLAYDPSVAEQTLRVLAAWQGTDVDDYRDEQPGKILHELRVGELATIEAVPHHPFYGSVDSTPLFCLLMARHARWTGKLDLFKELREHVDAALEWIDKYGDSDGDGFIDYQSSTGKGLVNQGWKDSGNGIVNADGSLATPPIALVEVQGYVYAAKTELAELYERAGDAGRAKKLRDQAEQLRQRFEDRFWMKQQNTYALALQNDGRQCDVVSSNPGQAMWTGIVSPDRAAKVRDSLMSDDMFTGWGIRTLSSGATRYNPIGYHLGTVWPHDNAIIAAGFHRFGFNQEADRIAGGIVDAAAAFPEYRLPEVFAGYPRSHFHVPVHYPVACHPQAWAAGSVPYLLTTTLGLDPDAFAGELRIVRPALFSFVDRLQLHGLRVGDAECDLRFDRTAAGVAVEVTRLDGRLNILVEPAPASDRVPADQSSDGNGRGKPAKDRHAVAHARAGRG